MKRSLVVPLLGCLLIVVQLALSHLIFRGTIGIELALILVMYAGIRGRLVPGVALAFLLGFVHDSLTVAMPCFFMCFYVSLFFISFTLSTKIFSESVLFVATFCFLATLFEGVAAAAAGRLIHGADIAHVIVALYLPQAIVCGMAGPPCFMIFNRVEACIDGKGTESAAQL